MQTVIQTPTFLADAKAAGVMDDELSAIAVTIAADPQAGDVIPGTGGARKVRIGGKGKGKSGGYRIITFYAAEDVPVFLLALVSKGQRADISQADRNALRTILGTLADAYREGVAGKVSAMGQRRGETT
ncbi:type II toxin-antitoxin system RelE/ParE family toxin [Methylobacterium sp. WL120]|uniref:type II toxin-antitoxin system RelE/ParE family toxin n=1 Tax=Methylobacterium sp. WL120 TaxID=2603887 RepID=UPI0011C920D8|nr:type II toxin-antitoxin system RelE/ParE family toxin [Methylobacterium sp. WL120]TXM63973.1 addiction module toxin RelE [Methylobacterium sp. WL120]